MCSNCKLSPRRRSVKYGTTPTGCWCPAWRYRPVARPCKHVKRLTDAISTLREYRAVQEARNKAPTA